MVIVLREWSAGGISKYSTQRAANRSGKKEILVCAGQSQTLGECEENLEQEKDMGPLVRGR